MHLSFPPQAGRRLPYLRRPPETAAWLKIVSQAAWSNFVELRQTFPSAALVERLTVFNLAGNKFRRGAKVTYRKLFDLIEFSAANKHKNDGSDHVNPSRQPVEHRQPGTYPTGPDGRGVCLAWPEA
jgi:mRNA-degrading endonuclease HigB of HigAB toxin-antitoxin module